MGVLCFLPFSLPAKDKIAEATWKKNMEDGKKALEAGQYYEASDRYTDALALAEKFEPDDSRLSENLRQLAAVHLGLHEYAPAKTFELRAVGLEEKKYGTNDYHLIDGYLLLAEIYEFLGEFPAAESYFGRAQPLAEWKFGKYDRVVGYCVEKRAESAMSAGQLEEAEKLFKEAIPLLESNRRQVRMDSNLHAKNYVDRADQASVWSAWNGLGLVYRQEKKFVQSEEAFNKSIHLVERNYGKNNRVQTSPLFNLAVTLSMEKKYDAAEITLRRAMDIAQSIGPDHPFNLECKKLWDEIEHQKNFSTSPGAPLK